MIPFRSWGAATWLAIGLTFLGAGCDKSPNKRELHEREAHAKTNSTAQAADKRVGALASAPARVREGTRTAGELSAISMNLARVRSWTPQRVFVDAFKQARDWTPQEPGSDRKADFNLKTDEDGWVMGLAVGKAAGTAVGEGGVEAYPPGRWVILYEGKGQIEVGRTGRKVSEIPGRIVVDSKPGGILIQITKSDEGDPIREVRVVPLAREEDFQSHPFHEPFLKQLGFLPFGILRFMDMGDTNESAVKEWSDRTTPNFFSQGTSRGVALEHLIDLANTLEKDPWFCVPHEATDDYVRKMMVLIKSQLKSGLTVYLEYSNEVWNRRFSQARYARDKGQALKLSGDPGQAQMRFYSQRAVEIFAIAQQELGASFPLVRVLSGQAANPRTGEQILSWKEAARHADAYAIAPYFGGRLGDLKNESVVTWPADRLIDDLAKEISTITKERIQENAALARRFGLRLIAYEGGQHLVGKRGGEDNEKLMQSFVQVNRHPRMAELYKQYLDSWRKAGGGEFVLYAWLTAPNKWGSWGLFESLGQTTTPKFQGVGAFVRANPDFTLRKVREAGAP